MKKVICILAAALMLFAIAACSDTGNPGGGTDAPSNATAAPSAKPAEATAEPSENTEDPAAATDDPAEATPVKEPGPVAKVDGLDALITAFDSNDEYMVKSVSGGRAEIHDDNPWVTIHSETSSDCYVVAFSDDGLEDEFFPEDYPYFACLYRVGFGSSIRETNHLYPITTAGGPSIENGWWGDIAWVFDRDWHLAVLNIPEVFPGAADKNAFVEMRFPCADENGGEVALAFMGAFKSEEDVQKYYNKYVEVHGSKLVKAEAPKIEKVEKSVNASASFSEFLYDFEDVSADSTVEELLLDNIEYCRGLNSSKTEVEDGNTVFNLVFDSIYYDGFVAQGKAYTLEMDVRNSGANGLFAGVLLNYGDERNEMRNFFEDNGVRTLSDGIIAGWSGIGVNFRDEKNVEIYVLRFDEEAVALKATAVIIDTGADLAGGLRHFVAHDNGTDTVTFSLDGKVFAKVEYSNEGLMPDTAFAYSERYYRTARICDGSGNELAAVEGSLISVYKSFGIGSRAHPIWIDNLSVKNG
ncbi:MAG: hypothetical protein ILO53_01485 [Clostridia bacterium]|nr:hypothetical protein [Clostridia bacterium]